METDLSILGCTDCAAHADTGRHILWDCLPVASYGDVRTARIITIGLNPADNLFYKRGTRERKPAGKRLPMVSDFDECRTRSCLNEPNRTQAREQQRGYFDGRLAVHPWFGAMRRMLSAADPGWTYESGRVAHVDSAACATDQWGRLSQSVRDHLRITCRPHFLQTLSEAPPDAWLLFNGRSAWQPEAVENKSGVLPSGRVIWSSGTFNGFRYFAWNVAIQRASPAVQVAIGEQLRAEYFHGL